MWIRVFVNYLPTKLIIFVFFFHVQLRFYNIKCKNLQNMKYNKYKYFIAITISISQYILLADLNISVKKKKDCFDNWNGETHGKF